MPLVTSRSSWDEINRCAQESGRATGFIQAATICTELAIRCHTPEAARVLKFAADKCISAAHEIKEGLEQ